MNMKNFFFAAGLALALVLATTPPPALALPGAHGPNGEHLDAPSGGGSSAPRIEANSEAFELVGQFQAGELSILINRFATNEPVVGAVVEVESGPLKAKATFHADHGDYAVADEAFLQALAKPGTHPLVVTVIAGDDADLLEGTLHVPQEAHDHAHDALTWRAWTLVALAAVFVGAVLWRLLRRRRTPSMDPARSAA